ncbi:MAG: hypothetical protein SGILL_003931, partial [Bacillariaceae sp.]
MWQDNINAAGSQDMQSSSDSNNHQAVIHGQDMALLQRPLLESPSGSDASKAGDDSVDGSIDDGGMQEIPHQERISNNGDAPLKIDQDLKSEPEISKPQPDVSDSVPGAAVE